MYEPFPFQHSAATQTTPVKPFLSVYFLKPFNIFGTQLCLRLEPPKMVSVFFRHPRQASLLGVIFGLVGLVTGSGFLMDKSKQSYQKTWRNTPSHWGKHVRNQANCLSILRLGAA